VLDDELISSKAVDIEVKTLSSRKSGKEGSTVDVICDSFFQLIVGMGLQTSSETQEGNVKQLLSSLPRTNNLYDSPLGPILACDRGRTVCASVGSGHPIFSKSELNKVLEHHQNQGNCAPMMTAKNWSMKDDENVLRGPEIRIAPCDNVGEKTLHEPKKCISLQLDSPAWTVLYVIGQQLQNLQPSLSFHHYSDHPM